MILVTGGAGFIGSVLIRELNRKNQGPVILVDDLSASKKKNIEKLTIDLPLGIDELWEKRHTSLREKVRAVYHLGAISSTTEKNWQLLEKYNIHYSQKIFEFCTQKKIPLIYASSAATYGDGRLGFNDDHALVEKLTPLNLYGKSKNDFDRWALAQKKTPPFWAGIKFFNVYGPNEYHKEAMRSVIKQAHEQLVSKGYVRLFTSQNPQFADGEQLRDFIYVFDATTVLIEMMKNLKQENSGLYNLGTGEARSFNDLVKASAQALKVPAKIEYFDPPKEISAAYQYVTQARMEKLLAVLPGTKFSSLEAGISHYINDYLEKSDPYA